MVDLRLDTLVRIPFQVQVSNFDESTLMEKYRHTADPGELVEQIAKGKASVVQCTPDDLLIGTQYSFVNPHTTETKNGHTTELPIYR